MNDFNETIKTMSKALDDDTKSMLSTNSKLLLVGSEDSVFLKNVKRKADTLGVPCEIAAMYINDPDVKGVVVDRETAKYPVVIEPVKDIDCLSTDEHSCVAEAIFILLHSHNLIKGKLITIIGRGHAVKGLAQLLSENDATVTVAHSKTPDLYQVTHGVDVVINATPSGVRREVSPNVFDLVVDLSGSYDPEGLVCPRVTGIGRLTTSILLNRFVGWCG